MNREDLKEYKYNKEWIKNRTEWIKEQQTTINKLGSIVSDLPKGSNSIYDKEAERLADLNECFDELMEEIVFEKKKQKKIVDAIKMVKQPYRNILFKSYIQGKSLVKVANEMDYNYEYMKKMNGIALNKFDDVTKSY